MNTIITKSGASVGGLRLSPRRFGSSPLVFAAAEPTRVGYRHTRATIVPLVLAFFAGTAHAHWFSTTYALKGGWNAIYLHGDATHAVPDVLIPNSGDGAAVQEVWRWNPKPNQVQFTHSPLIPAAGTPEWNVWKRGIPAQSNLSQMTGQTAYLVKCAGTAATTYNVPIIQKAMPPAATWVRSGANLLGFPTRLIGAAYPSFSTYFQSFPAATTGGAKIYKYVGGDLSFSNPIQVFSTTGEQVDRNKAYWFEAEVVGNFYAPLNISLSQATGLDFGRNGSVVTALVRNTTAANITLTLTPVASIAAPPGQDAITGQVPLTRRTFDTGTASWTETPITAAYTEVIGANSTVELNFGINRAAMSTTSNALYASLLRLTDSANLFDISLPASARVASMAGLWVGDATVTGVASQVQSTATAKAVLRDGVVTGIEITGGGFGYSSVPEPVIAAPTATAAATVTLSPGVAATATAVLTGGVVTGFNITNAGSGYTTTPAISIAAPASGTTATATAVLTGGILTGITITNGGSGYTSAPAVTIRGPRFVTGITLTSPGSGYATAPTVTIGTSTPALGVRATAVATVSNGVITGLTLTDPGSGYTASTPAVTIGAPTEGTATAVVTRSGGAAAAATAVLTGGSVTAITITNGGTGYTDVPAVGIAAPASGTRATATAVLTNGVVTGITIDDGGSGYTAAPAVTIGGRTITSITLTNPGSGYTTTPTVTIGLPGGGLGTRATAVATMRDGIITGLVLTNGGAEYSGTPTVTISSPPPGSAPAAATAVVSAGGISSISVNNPGSGYFAPPAVSITPPASGTTATAVAVVNNGRVTGITVTDRGSGYTSSPLPVVSIDPPPAPVPATATAVVQNGKITGFTINDGGRGYSAVPAITIPAPVPMGTATARRPPLRVILHVNDSGTASLLSQVFIGTLLDGSSGLCTRESGLKPADKAGASRIVAAHLPLDRVLTSGSGSVALGQTLVRTVSIPFDDDTNPFVHRYHPDHNNKDARGMPLGAGVESYGIARTLNFEFTATPPAGVSAAGWGSTSIGGNYTEVIKGLHKKDLTVTGTFVLRRASEIGTLTPP